MLCWLFRFAISHTADADNPLGSATTRHLKTCISCREFYDFCRLLNINLHVGAKVLNRDIPAALQEQILHSIDEIGTKNSNTRIKIWPIAFAAVLTVIILLGGIYYFTGHQVPKTPVHQNELNVAGVTEELSGLVATGIEWTKSDGALENTLKVELQNITDDTESAVRFLFACVNVDIVGVPKTKEGN